MALVEHNMGWYNIPDPDAQFSKDDVVTIGYWGQSYSSGLFVDILVEKMGYKTSKSPYHEGMESYYEDSREYVIVNSLQDGKRTIYSVYRKGEDPKIQWVVNNNAMVKLVMKANCLGLPDDMFEVTL